MSDDAKIVINIKGSLDKAIDALRDAQKITPERTPFRRIDKLISVAFDLAMLARDICEANSGKLENLQSAKDQRL